MERERELFTTEDMEPLFDGFNRYKPNASKSRIEYRPIYIKKLETLYKNLALLTMENSEPREDFGHGKLQMTPLEFHVSLHKITQMLYRPNRKSYNAKLIKSLSLHNIENNSIEDKSIKLSFDSPIVPSDEFKDFFTRDKRVTMQTLLKASIYQKYGSLRWMQNYKSISFKFAQESHLYNSHWLMGAFKRLGKYYSFVIHIRDENLSKAEARERIKNLMELVIISINRAGEIRHGYMESVFGN